MSASSQGTSSPLQVGLNIAKLCTGAGLLGLPRAFQQSGILAGVIGMIVVVALNNVGCRLLVSCKSAMNTILLSSRGWDNIDDRTMSQTRTLSYRSTYSALARLTIGRHGPAIVEISIVVTLWGACAVYLITIGQLLHEVYGMVSQYQYTLIAGLVLLPFSFCSDLSFLSWASLSGVLCYAVAYTSIFYYGATTYSLRFDWNMVPIGAFYELMEFAGVAFFSLGIPLLTFSLQESMKDQSKFLPTLDRTLTIIALIYVAIGVIGYGLFVNAPGSVHSIIISNLPEGAWYAGGVKLILVATLLFSAPLSLVPSLNMLRSILNLTPLSLSLSSQPNESTKLLSARPSLLANGHDYDHANTNDIGYGSGGNDGSSLSNGSMSVIMVEKGSDHHDHMSVYNNSNRVSGRDIDDDNNSQLGGIASNNNMLLQILSVASVVIITLVAVYVPCFSLVLSMIGAVTITLLCFILPPLFYLILFHHHALTATLYHRIAAASFIICGVAVMFGSFAIVSKAQCE